MRSLQIGTSTIDDESDAWICAEIGHNHQGNIETCEALFRAAKEAGCNAVKLQKRDNRTLFTDEASNRPYNSEHAFGPTYGAHREALEFGAKEYERLDRLAYELGLTFFATPFDTESACFLADHTRLPAFKIASADVLNLDLLRFVAGFQKPIILSTGGCTFQEVQAAVRLIEGINPQLALLQCTAEYPTLPEHVNLRVIEMYRDNFKNLVVGLSSHVSGIWDGPPAYVLGARIFEKHFTLNRAMKGSDHAFSLEPAGMKKFVRDLRRTGVAFCPHDGHKARLSVEVPAMAKMRESTRWWNALPQVVTA